MKIWSSCKPININSYSIWIQHPDTQISDLLLTMNYVCSGDVCDTRVTQLCASQILHTIADWLETSRLKSYEIFFLNKTILLHQCLGGCGGNNGSLTRSQTWCKLCQYWWSNCILGTTHMCTTGGYASTALKQTVTQFASNMSLLTLKQSIETVSFVSWQMV